MLGYKSPCSTTLENIVILQILYANQTRRSCLAAAESIILLLLLLLGLVLSVTHLGDAKLRTRLLSFLANYLSSFSIFLRTNELFILLFCRQMFRIFTSLTEFVLFRKISSSYLIWHFFVFVGNEFWHENSNC